MPSKKLDFKQCEICGKQAKLISIIIEGSMLQVCKDCAGFGKTVLIPEKPQIKEKQKPVKIKIEETILITKEYPKLIKDAREKSNLKQKDLAEKAGEKESVIHQLESGILEPSLILAKKLENILKIKLIETHEENKENINFSDSSTTIGDLIKLKRKQ